jgi:hypothetical protein
MHRFNSHQFFKVCSVLTLWSERGEADSEIPKDQRDQGPKVETYRQPLIDIGFSASAASLKKIVATFGRQGSQWKDLCAPAKECLDRLIDEAENREFFVLTARESDYFKKPRRGWELSIARFPEITGDVEEASKCFALSRYGAAIFHSLQVVEAGLIELGVFIKVNDPKSGWTAVSAALNRILKKDHRDRTRFEKRNFHFLEQVHGTIEGLKNAWRNKISHAHGKLILMTPDFSPEISEEILFATRAFMRRLAEGLPAAKPKKNAV